MDSLSDMEILAYVAEVQGLVIHQEAYKIPSHSKHYKRSNGKVVCKVCGKKYIYSASMIKHLHRKHNLVEKLYECKVCNVKYPLKTQYISHVRSYNHRNNLGFDLQYSDNPNRCNLCNLSFENSRLYFGHIYSNYHKSRLGLVEVNPEKKTYECGMCGTKFSRRYNLTVHIRNLH